MNEIGVSLHKEKHFRSLEAFLFTYHMTITCCHFSERVFAANSDAIFILLEVMFIYERKLDNYFIIIDVFCRVYPREG